MKEDKHPKVGVAVIVRKDGKVLMGKRKNAHGEGTWHFSGGHLEFNEEIEDCAHREVKEETGISIKNIILGPYTNDFFGEEGKHYLTLYVMCDYDLGKVETKEPDKCEGWEWHSWEKLPRPLFVPIENFLKKDYNPFA